MRTTEDLGAQPSGVPPRATDGSLFVRACRGERGARPPVWFMRQAGRALPEYRAIRDGVPMLESCMRPDLTMEITLQPVRRYGVDAAIYYSDIVLPLKAIGVRLDIVGGVGPVIAEPIRDASGVRRLRSLEPDDVLYVSEAVRGLVARLGPTPLVGFAGAPFTLASYLVEGGPSKDQARTKALMHSDPGLWHDLMTRLADISAAYLKIQVDAGASAVQLFDSWAGSLSLRDYQQHVQPHSRAVLAAAGELGVPRIHFGVGTSELLVAMRDAGADVMGIDWRVPLDEAARRLGPRVPLQGNLDPALLGAPWHVLRAEVDRILEEGRAAPAHIFNLGHGVPPSADPDVLRRVVDHVRGSES